MFKAKLSNEVLEKVRERIKFSSPKDIALELGMHPETISKVARLYFKYRGKRNNPNPKKEIDIKKALTMRDSGMSYRSIAKSLNVAHMVVYNRLRDHGLVNGICDR